jgi:hypothetical protein
LEKQSLVAAGHLAPLSQRRLSAPNSKPFYLVHGLHHWSPTNTTEATLRHVKATLNPYNRQTNYMLYLAEYMFWQKCKATESDPLMTFMVTVKDTDWSNSE